jgi:hypothetical protein
MTTKFVVKKTTNREDDGHSYISWDIAKEVSDVGFEFVAEFHNRHYAILAAQALNNSIKH